jgi:hypothetical protein
MGSTLGPPEKAVGNGFGMPAMPLHSVWGRVVPDIPAFCRELVAALAEG